ncbi:thiamine phosphate synthase [Pelagibacteraceae bacterium]|nr:thiamine phosphate synthase [Pelagibacteraceae bacterium]
MKRLVYLISPNKIYSNFYKDLEKVLSSKKVFFFQLRLKNKSKISIIKIARKIKKITKKYKVKLIINDNSKLAKKIGADGCHIGQLDSTISLARKDIKNKIIGITCHNSKKLALKALKNKADYLAFGSFFKSKLKPNAKKADLKILLWAKKNIKKPIVVIGGITDKNYKKLILAGANYIAISSFIWNNPILKPSIAINRFK